MLSIDQLNLNACPERVDTKENFKCETCAPFVKVNSLLIFWIQSVPIQAINRPKIDMSSGNLYRTENYQNYINSYHQKTRLEKSISDVQKKIDDDSDSLNSVAESLNNYLDVKVCTLLSD